MAESWAKVHLRQYGFRLHREKDIILIDFLAKKKNVSGYIKKLIKADYKKTNQ